MSAIENGKMPNAFTSLVGAMYGANALTDASKQRIADAIDAGFNVGNFRRPSKLPDIYGGEFPGIPSGLDESK